MAAKAITVLFILCNELHLVNEQIEILEVSASH